MLKIVFAIRSANYVSSMLARLGSPVVVALQKPVIVELASLEAVHVACLRYQNHLVSSYIPRTAVGFTHTPA